MPSGGWMTWGQFKESVERQLREKGVKNPDDIVIDYVDIQGWNRDDVRPRLTRDGHLEVES